MFKLLVTVLSLLHYGWCDIECYDCTSASGPNQDDDCAQDGYSGHTTSYSSWKSCLTETHVTGSVRRYGSTIPMEDGECMGFGNSMTCYCLASLCNNDLCQDCGVDFSTTPLPLTTATPPPESTTTPEETATTPIETTDMTYPTTDATDITTGDVTTDDVTTAFPETTTTMRTTNEPGEGLNCYVCVDCPVVDENTSIVHNEDYKSCVTTIALSGNFIIRGGDYTAHPDGDCIHEDGGMVCFCRGDLCNDESYGGL